MKFKRKVILGKIEPAYATDPTPTEGANALLVENLEVVDIAPIYEARNYVRPYYANEGEIVAGWNSSVSFSIPLAGSGALGTAPKWGPVIRGCGMAETINAGVSVAYDPVSAAEESLTYWYRVDGRQHRILGWRGTYEIAMAKGGVPSLKFSGMALHVQPTDVALGTPTLTGWQTPVAFNKANTTTLTLHGTAVVASAFSYNHANEAPYRDLPNAESVVITGRKPVGSITFEDNLVATKDWWTLVKSGATGVLAIVHGPALNQVKIDAPAVQLTAPQMSDGEGILMRQLGLHFKPSAGNDEIKITVL